MRKICFAMWLCSAAIATTFGSVSYAQQASEAPSIKTKSEEVVLDVVVRDKKGRAVNDLKPEDFQVFDNGEQKKIVSFRLVQGTEAIASSGLRMQLDPLRQIRLVTMIFQCWNNDARRLARDAAVDLLKNELPQNVYLAVMTIDHKLEVLQAFTNDRDLLRKAIDRATRSENTDFSADTAQVRKQLEQMLGPNTSGAQSAQGQIDNANATLAAQGRSVDGAAMANVAMAQMILQMLETEQSNAMVEGGRTNIFALLDAVKEQYRLPGRKTILYFSEGGFVIPQGMEEPFKTVISIANRSNVSFYALDTHGLTTWNSNSGSIDTLKRAAQSSADQMNSSAGDAVRPDEAKLFDTTIQSTRGNTQNTLASLAESTGGALIANTNDFRGPLHKLTEDILTYYEITYVPDIKSYDGSFRKIAVKMSSNDLHVQTRSGYIALPPTLAAKGGLLHSHEVPLLAALDTSDLPHAFNYHSEALHFRGPQDQSVCDLVMDVPLGVLTFHKNSADQFEGRLSYVALVKDAKGEVIKKFQNDLPITVAEAKFAALQASHFIYTEHFDLPPGRYVLETAVLDGAGSRISARKASIMMPASSDALALSSVSIVRDTKDKEAATNTDDPMLVGSKLISPTLDPVIRKADGGAVSFYMVIYPNKKIGTPPQLVMEFSKDGQVLGSASPQLGEPDKDGRIRNVATAPLSALPAGEFMIRFIVKQGSETAEEPVTFSLQ